MRLKSLASHKAKTFGWQGFHFEFPENWQLTAEGGDTLTGKLKFEADDSRFELKWEPIQKERLQLLSELTERFVQQLRKSEKTVTCRKGKTSIHRHQSLFVHFKTNIEGYTFFWYCHESSRFLVGQFTFKKVDSDTKEAMKKILRSLRCHSLDQNVWSILGFSFEIPKSFKLIKRKMVVGRTSLSFLSSSEEERRPFTEQRMEILFEHFSLANVQFETIYTKPKKWIDKYYFDELKKRYRGLKLEAARSRRVQGHLAAVKNGTASSGMTLRRKALFILASWHCPEMNRMYSVTASKQVGRPIFFRREVNEEDLKRKFKRLLASVICH